MPFLNAPWALLLLAPVVIFAFWPSYFGDLSHASVAFHAHGLTATAWLALVGFQSVTAQRRDRGPHRAAGRAVFVLAPLFTGAAVLVMHSMAIKFTEGTHPFYAALGARLGLHDLISTTVLVGMVCAALVWRRRIAIYAGSLLATVLLVLPPVIARLPLPRFFHSGEVLAVLIAGLVIWRRLRRERPSLSSSACRDCKSSRSRLSARRTRGRRCSRRSADSRSNLLSPPPQSRPPSPSRLHGGEGRGRWAATR